VRAFSQALKYSSSVEDAGAPTAVVTPPGDTATCPGAAVGVSDVPEVWVVVADDEDEDVVGSLSDPDEQPVPTMTTITNDAATAARRECLRMQPIYAMPQARSATAIHFGSA
jgi:hypothetical protein